MREQTLRTLEVFRYVAAEQPKEDYWNKEAIGRIDSELATDESLSRLSALILKKATDNIQLAWFSQHTQLVLKNTATQLMVDVAAKKHFIQQLIPILKRNNISVILLKGMAFNHNLYSETAPRGVSDIDILIKPADQERFKTVFTELAHLVENEKKHAFDDLYEQTWRANNNQHLIDVHTHLTNPHLFDISETALWKRSVPHPAYGTEQVRILSAEDTVCHLVTHMINDTNFYHYNLIDVRALLTQQPIDKALLAATAKNWGVLIATQFVLQKGHDTVYSPSFAISSPKQHACVSVRAKLASFIIRHLLTIPSHEKSALHRLKQLSCYLFVVDKGTLIFKILSYYILARIKN